VIKSGDADAILVYRLDRLARDLVLQEILLREIHSTGGVLLTAIPGENELLRDPMTRPAS
jgi:DNA invertase Pin-like site-specific DNA recombinase